MTIAKIEATLIYTFDNSGFSIATAYENREYVPVNGTPYAKITILHNQPEIVTLGNTGEDEHTGVMQVDLFYPINAGKGLALAKADAIRAIFKGGARLTYNNQMVIISSCGSGASRNEDGWFRQIVNINWWARTARS